MPQAQKPHTGPGRSASRYQYYRVRKLLAALDDVIIRFQDTLVLNGQILKASYDDGVVTICPPNNGSWDEMVMSVIHELWHHSVDFDKEYVLDEALDKAAFRSNLLKWHVSRKMGDFYFGFEKYRA